MWGWEQQAHSSRPLAWGQALAAPDLGGLGPSLPATRVWPRWTPDSGGGPSAQLRLNPGTPVVLGRTHSGFQAHSEPSMVPVLRKTSRNLYVWYSRSRDPLTAGPRSPGATVNAGLSPPGPTSAMGHSVRSPTEPAGPGSKSFPYTGGWRGNTPVPWPSSLTQTAHSRGKPAQGPRVGWRCSPREPSTAAAPASRGAPMVREGLWVF